jgi:hypothetical protein
MKRRLVFLISLSVFIVGCGDSNWFKFSHKSGSNSNNIASLTSDADVALLNKDFGAALNYYEQILEKDGANSEALYGASAAALGAAGLDLATIITNVLQNKDKTGSPALTSLVYKAARVSQQSTGSLLPPNLDWIALRAATAKAITYLRRITNGQTDGVITSNNSSVRVNLIVCYVIHYAIKAVDLDEDGIIENDADDPITIANNYSITYSPSKFETAAETDKAVAILDDFLNNIIDEITANFDALIAAFQVDAGSTISDLKNDILTEFKAEVIITRDAIAALY